MDVRLPCSSYISDCKEQKCTNLVSNGKTFIRSFVTSDELVLKFQGRHTASTVTAQTYSFSLKSKNSLNGNTSCPVRLAQGNVLGFTWEPFVVRSPFTGPLLPLWETAVAQWLRCCATNRNIARSIPAGVNGILHWHNPISLWSWGRLSL
jgi:hypothetical protein